MTIINVTDKGSGSDGIYVFATISNKNSKNTQKFDSDGCLQIEGERRVLAANGSNGTLATCAIRPSGIFGEGDATFFPTLVAKARQGKLKYYIGNGRNLVDFTYVGNVAQAHIEVNKLCLLRDCSA